MDKIILQDVLPHIFSQEKEINSEIWQKNIIFEKGNFYLLEATSGKGKTSLCYFIYGCRYDYNGIIFFDKEDVKEIKPNQWSDIRKNSLGMLFQGLRLFPELSSMENVLLKNSLTGFKTQTWINEAFETLGIMDKKDTLVQKLSFGQQQRVAMIRALCQPLDFLLLDEPVSHLDDDNNRKIGELVSSELRAQGAGIIVTSIGKHLQLNYDKILSL